MISFFVIRHGETLLNRLGRAQGWSDSPLTPRGVETAMELGAELRGTVFRAAYASDTIRAEQTAKLVLSASGNDAVEVRKEPRLREWCLGRMEAEDNTVFIRAVSDWLGVSSFAELNRRLPDVAETIREKDTTGMTETFTAIAGRLKGVLTEAAGDRSLGGDGNILVVTHAFAIKTLLYLFAPETLFAMGKVKNAAVFRLVYDGGEFSLRE